MPAKKQFPLDALRTDGWFERIGEGIGSFQALCEIVGERFFAFSISRLAPCVMRGLIFSS